MGPRPGLAAALVLAWIGLSAAAAPAAPPGAAPFVDGHIHIDEKDPATAVALLVQSMDQLGEAHAVIQTAPYGPGDPDAWDMEKVEAEIAKHRGRVALAGGGGTLNPMLVQAAATGEAGPEAQRRLRARAEEILRQGAAGFGELSNEHFGLPTGGVKSYQTYPADSPLMLLLADIAAEHDVPIDLHMEAVPEDMASGLPPPNPPRLRANIQGLEQLLAHNRRAKIIWAHVGADNTGFRTADRMRPMLKANPNLYMEIKIDPAAPGKTYLLSGGKLKPEWLALFSEFPDRFILGSDQHYDTGSMASLARIRAELAMLGQLPAPVRRQIAAENAERLYHLRP